VVGTQVTITGANFGATQGANAVTFNGTQASAFTSWSATSIVTTVPAGATTGSVVVTVGGVASNSVNFTVVAGSFTLTANLTTARMFHTATLLNSGMVLVAGGVDGFAYDTITSAELYNPGIGTFTTTGSLNTGRIFNTSTLLANGQVLVAGGSDSNWNQIGTAELYHPTSGTFTFTGNLNTPRTSQTATLLNNGRVLMAGGWDSNGDYISSDADGAELYDPASGTFMSTGNLNVARDTHTATLLNDGTVLIAGGFDNNGNTLSSAEIYDPVAGTFTLTGSLNIGRAVHTATLLNNGMVLIAGGYDINGNAVASAELYNPATQTFTVTGSMNTPRYDGAQGTLLSNGTILLAGGQDNNGNTLASAEIYDPTTGSFTLTGDLNVTRQSLTTTLLNNGQVLVAAGMDFYANVLNSAELYQPSTLAPAGLVSIALSPSNPSVPVGATQRFTATGTFSDYSTQILASVTWTSSDSTIVTIATDPGDRGNAAAEGAGSATVSACAGSVCGSTTMTVLGPPSITGLSPNSGPVGASVTITGTNFGSGEGSSTLTFNGMIATTIMNWSPTSIVAMVPSGATTGNVVITVDGIASPGFNFTVTSTGLSNALNISRYQHSATLLNNGTVLIAGGATCPTVGSCIYLNSAEVYNPGSGTSTTTGSLATPRAAPAVLLANGNVLIAGGSACDGYGNCFSLSSAEIYSPNSGTFSSAGNMQTTRDGQTMTLLPDGRVLIAGGESCVPGSGGGGGSNSRNFGDPRWDGAHLVDVNFTPTTGSITCTALASAEIYDPQAGTFSLTGSLNTARYDAAAAQLANGQILVVGGSTEYNPLNSAELYDPSTASFTPTANGLGTARSSPAATLLNSGVVLISGGSTCESPTCPTNTAELYDPNANSFQYASGNMNASRVNHTAVLLTNGQVLLAGGADGCSGNACTSDATTELYDPTAGTFTNSQGLGTARSGHTSTLLSNGSVLLAGGIASGITLSSVEFYQPGSLTPSGLVSITVAPANTSIIVGGIQQFVATGTFSDSSTSTLQSASWISSSPTVAVINNAAGSSGFALGVGLGSTTLTATVGTISGSGTLTVQPPVQSGSFTTTAGQMGASLYGQTATRLTTGQVLITGGMSTSGVVNTAQLYAPSSQLFAAGNSMNVARWLHTATLLNDGTVLIAGGSDLANKETLDSAEIYNPTTGTFTLLTNTLNFARVGHSATLLNNGQVLIVGGYDPETGLIADAELYDPATQTFIDLGDTQVPRYEHTATILQNGRVLIAGGETDSSPSGAYNTAELFDPVSQSFTLVSVPMTTAREGHAAVLLNNGQVLITGGYDPGTGPLNTAEVYDPVSDVFLAVTSTMTTPRISHAMTLLNGGQVLIVGGTSGANGTALASTETYNPTSQLFTAAGSMASVREYQTDTLLNDGTVFIAGGTDGTNIFNNAELYMASQLIGLTSIAVTPASPSIGMGGQQLFTAVGTLSNGNTESLASVLWNSSNASVATISNDATDSGVAASLIEGTATLTASALGMNGSATLTITAPTLVSVQLSPQSPTIPLGATQQFTATGVYTDGSTQDLTSSATWSSSASVVATINSSGLAAALFQGVSTVQVSFGSVNATTNLNVASAALVSMTVNPASATIAIGGSQPYQAMGTYSDGSTQNVTGLVSWSSATTAVATISNTGVALGASQGNTTVSASFESISASVPLTVGAPSLVSLVITPNAGSLSTGATLQLVATGNYTDGSTQNLTSSSSWTSSSSGVLGVSTSGLATAGSVGEATITATSGSISGTVVLIVTSGTTQANLNTSRYLHSATMLETGQILVAGGVNCPSAGSCTYLNNAEIYNPAGSTFTNTGAMSQTRSAPAVLLNNGNVLIAGGYTCDASGNCSSLSSSEIYSPSAATFSTVGNLTVARSGQTMTLLSNGTVLIAGGQTCTTATSCSALSSAEIYDPVAGTFTATSNGMSAARFGASAVLLNSGLVLIAGGFDGTNLPAAAEIYNPTQPGFTGGHPQLNTPRFNATATLLNNGQVLVAGGSTCALPGCPTNAAEIYDPVANTFTLVSGGMNVPRFEHSATLLTNGQVVIAGGFSSCSSSCTSEASTEFFDPVAGQFSSSQSVSNALAGQTGILTANGNALLIGGINAGVTLAADEWYQPTSYTPPGLVSISVTPASLLLMPGLTQQLVATGTFNDGSTQTLQSVIWTSSNPSAALVSNSPGNAGIANAQATGATTITATAGDVGSSATVNVQALASLSLTPANPTLTTGRAQQFAATATYSDGSTQNVTTSATWTASNNSTLFLGTGLTGPSGYAVGTAAGTVTITATLGSTQASTSVTVRGPATPSIGAVSPTSGQSGTQVTITGAGFGSPQGGGIVWLGSAPATVVSWTDMQIVATVAPISTSGNAQVEENGLFSNVVPFTVNTATISNVSPSTGVAGTQVTITGSGFGATQGNGSVWLGSTPGVVVSWSDTQIVATVSSIAKSGIVQVQQNGLSSNAVPFNVNTATISNVSPSSGVPGTQVSISGSGFGATQGSGQVWLGTANALVQSWSDSQVVAVVGNGSTTGNAVILQNGVMSNAVPFAINTLQVTSVNPSSGVPGTVVTINGNGFGTSQENGIVWLGSTSGEVLSWSNTKILAAVASNAVTGVARVQQNEVWSNAVTFTVPVGFGGGGGSGQSATLVPNLFNLVVGQTQAIQALNSSGQPVTGLTWTSSNPQVISLSTDDPPILTALSAGRATIAAGNSSADVTVYSGASLPLGTTIWSNPGDGSGVTSIVPAVPSATGVADVFAQNGDCNAQAITSDGTVGWTANIGQPPQYSGNPNSCNPFVPDFQGGMVIKSEISTTDVFGDPTFHYQLQRFDGMTGQAYPASTPVTKWWTTLNSPGPGFGPGQYDFFVPPFVVHTDGTIFSLGGTTTDPTFSPLGGVVNVIDPLTGQSKASIGAGPAPTQPGSCLIGDCPNGGGYVTFGGFGNLIVAGDGYAYVPYSYVSVSWPPVCVPQPPVVTAYGTFPQPCRQEPPCTTVSGTQYDSAFTGTDYLNLLRIDTSGNASSITLGSWSTSGDCYAGTYAAPTNANVITNADQGTLVTWQLDTGTQGSAGQSKQTTYYIATTSGTSLASQNTTPSLLTPVLQAQDGTFFGTSSQGMVRFDQSGNIKWNVGDSPKIATADNGVIGISGTTYDSGGSATGQTANPNDAWTGNSYQLGSVDKTFSVPPDRTVPPYWSSTGANQSVNSASPLCHDDRDRLVTEYGYQVVGDISYGRTPYPRFTPSCYLATNSAHSQYFTFSELNDACPSRNNQPEFSWALIKNPLIVASTAQYGLDAWRLDYGSSRIINSAYRDPIQNLECTQTLTNPSGNPNSRHSFGDAVDLRNQSAGTSGALTEWKAMQKAAKEAHADWTEPQDGPCGLSCFHADWRKTDRNMYNTITIEE
jgi:N-acetylneuraminic acid mutarotase